MSNYILIDKIFSVICRNNMLVNLITSDFKLFNNLTLICNYLVNLNDSTEFIMYYRFPFLRFVVNNDFNKLDLCVIK